MNTFTTSAPALAPEDMDRYRVLTDRAPHLVSGAMKLMLTVLEEPEARLSSIALEETHRIFDAIPGGPKDSPAWELQRACFHLLRAVMDRRGK